MTEYKCTSVTTVDYGDGPAAGKSTMARLVRLPDGGHWLDFPTTIDVAVPEGTRPGTVYELRLRIKP